MYIRFSLDEIVHERILYNLIDWFADVGGIAVSLSLISVVLFGPYMSFNCGLEIIHNLYHQREHDEHEKLDHCHDHDEKDDIICHMGHCSRIALYFM